MGESASEPELSGLLVRGSRLPRAGVPIEDVAFCMYGHLTAPGWKRRRHYLLERLRRGLLYGFLTCEAPSVDGLGHHGLCGIDLEWVEDYGPEVVAAWALGGAEAAYAIIRTVWSHTQDLRPW